MISALKITADSTAEFGLVNHVVPLADLDLPDLPRLLADHEVHAPTQVNVGEVVQLREKLEWFEGAQAKV